MTKEEAIKYFQQLYPNGGHCWLDEQRIEAIGMAINALQEEPASEDLEEEIRRYMDNTPTRTDLGQRYKDISIVDLARHFANWQKQQMMKKAISGEVKEGLAVGNFGWEDSGWIETDTFRIEKYALKANDKVKLIIIKED